MSHFQVFFTKNIIQAILCHFHWILHVTESPDTLSYVARTMSDKRSFEQLFCHSYSRSFAYFLLKSLIIVNIDILNILPSQVSVHNWPTLAWQLFCEYSFLHLLNCVYHLSWYVYFSIKPTKGTMDKKIKTLQELRMLSLLIVR